MALRVLALVLLGCSAPVVAEIEWEPFVEPYSQVFPSLAIATATMPADPGEDDPAVVGDQQGLIGVEVSGAATGTRFELIVRVPGWARDSRLAGRIPKVDESVVLAPTIAWDYAALAGNRQSRPANVEFELKLGSEAPDTRTLRVRLRSVNDALYFIDEDEDEEDLDFNWLFAAYVNEDHPAVQQILKEALDAGVIDNFSGYQAGDKDDVLKQVYAVWHVLSQRGIRYSNITRTAHEHANVLSQHVRFIDESLALTQANCVDGSVLMASVLRKIDIAPVLVLIPGHMFLGFALDEEGEEWAYLETTMLGDTRAVTSASATRPRTPDVPRPGNAGSGGGGNPGGGGRRPAPREVEPSRVQLDGKVDASLASFEAALEEGQRQVDEAGEAFEDENNLDYQMIDIQAARELGVMPITR